MNIESNNVLKEACEKEAPSGMWRAVGFGVGLV
jgi:hypothetical protein